MGLEMHEIKEDEIKVKVKEGDKYKEEYSDLWKEVLKIYIDCFEKGKNVEDESILKSRSEYLLSNNPINGKTDKGLESHWLYFTDQKEKVGFAIIQDSGNKYCYIDYIGTATKGEGYGIKILNTLCKKYKEIELSAVPGVYSFYKKCGFHPENLIIKPRKPRNQAKERLLGKKKPKIGSDKLYNKIPVAMFKQNRITMDDTDFDKNHIKLDDAKENKKSKDDADKPNKKKNKDNKIPHNSPKFFV